PAAPRVAAVVVDPASTNGPPQTPGAGALTAARPDHNRRHPGSGWVKRTVTVPSRVGPSMPATNRWSAERFRSVAVIGAPFDQTAPRRRRKLAERKPAPSWTEPGCTSDG